MPLIPFGEYRPDVSDYQGTFTQVASNVLPRGDGYGPFPDFSVFSAALAGTCRGFFKAIKTDGTVAVFAATSTRVYLLNNSTLVWADVSLGGSAYTTLSTGDNWQFAQFGNFVLATQANVVLQVYDLTSSSAFANCAGSPPQARYVSVVGRFLVLSGLLSNPYRIQWSGLNATTTWTSGTNQSDYQDLPDGGIVRGVAGGEQGIIFQDGSIRRMTYAPGSPTIFVIQRIAEDKGLYAPYSLIRSGDRIFFLSSQGFNGMQAGGLPETIGKERVDRAFFADLDRGNLQLVIGASDPRSSRVFWAYKSNSGTAGLFDKLLCYDWALNRFAAITVSGEYIGSMSQPGMTLEGLDSLSGSIDAMTTSFDDYATSVTPEIAAFNSAHKLGFFRGSALEATMETPEQGTDGKRLFVRGGRPITDASTVYLSVSSRENVKDARTWSTESLVNTQGFCPQRVSTRYARGRVRIPAGTSWNFAAGVEPDVTSAGMR